jgi:hypothetical protein
MEKCNDLARLQQLLAPNSFARALGTRRFQRALGKRPIYFQSASCQERAGRDAYPGYFRRAASRRRIGCSGNAYAAHLAAARKGREVERLRVLVWAKDHGDDISDIRTARELARRKAAAAARRESKYLSAHELAK